jgi:hypothetical protein
MLQLLPAGVLGPWCPTDNSPDITTLLQTDLDTPSWARTHTYVLLCADLALASGSAAVKPCCRTHVLIGCCSARYEDSQAVTQLLLAMSVCLCFAPLYAESTCWCSHTAAVMIISCAPPHKHHTAVSETQAGSPH